jgi:hypothetical protein
VRVGSPVLDKLLKVSYLLRRLLRFLKHLTSLILWYGGLVAEIKLLFILIILVVN